MWAAVLYMYQVCEALLYIFLKLFALIPDRCNDCKPVRLVSLHFLQPDVVYVERRSWIRRVELQASLLRPICVRVRC